MLQQHRNFKLMPDGIPLLLGLISAPPHSILNLETTTFPHMDALMPIVELPERYTVDNERLGMALARVSAQANRLAEVHAVLTDQQKKQEARQRDFVEQRVAQARLEAEERTQELHRAIGEAYGDPSTVERRVDDRIQRVLTTLQDASLSQARAVAEAQLASQDTVRRAMEERITAAVMEVEERAARRAEQSLEILASRVNSDHRQVLQAAASDRLQLQAKVELLEQRTERTVALAKDTARQVTQSELDARLNVALSSLEERVVRRAEMRVLDLVTSLLEENRRQWQRQQLELQVVIEERVEERLREAIVVAKKAAETQARRTAAETVAAMSPAPGSSGGDTPATMAGSVADESTGESRALREARLQAQQAVVERARLRANELKGSADRAKRKARSRRKDNR
jgi:hypothetical protein